MHPLEIRMSPQTHRWQVDDTHTRAADAHLPVENLTNSKVKVQIVTSLKTRTQRHSHLDYYCELPHCTNEDT